MPIILVVGMRFGCLNHALLTAEAIRARRLPLAGWICNRIDTNMLALEENIAFFAVALAGPLLADIPYNAQPDARNRR